MKKEVKLVKKLSSLLKQLNCREYLHHFGPKKYKFVYHALALLLKESLSEGLRNSQLNEKFACNEVKPFIFGYAKF